jgi:glycosyltransferase involved in cell wall biosynthesis/nucleoside-diphosphate-sugar epimerase
MRSLDVICPVFREEQVIGIFHERLVAVFDRLAERYACRVIYVLDPSPDQTESILSAIAAADPRVDVLVMSRRFGHQAALIAGMDYSDGDALIMLDCDLQHPPELIPDLLRHWEEGADIVQMVRQEGGETSRLKRASSRWFYAAFLKLSEVELPAGAADYRLLSRRVNEVFREELREHNPFLRGLVSWVGYKVTYIPFTPLKRERGASKYRPSTLLNFALTGLSSFSKVPLRVCIIVGLVMAALSLSGALVQIVAYAFGDVEVPGWASLFSAVTLIGGVQLFFLGVLGEFISLIFDEVKDRPRYLINKRYGQERMKPVKPQPHRSSDRLQRPVRSEYVSIRRIARTLKAPFTRMEGWYGSELDALVTGRKHSLFGPDMESNAGVLGEAIRGRRALVVGGGGSIGSVTTRILLNYCPKAVHVVDQNENCLAELVRDLRGRPEGLSDIDFRTFPLDYGSPIMERLLNEAERYDIVMHFAALKHVRSEKDVHSAIQMLDTNVVRHIRFKQWVARNDHGHIYFAVSTDKAANPTSLMGASKRMMEDVVFGVAAEHAISTTSARFANVAFSNGSLLQSFLQRLERRQPFAVPRETRRYFISHSEAGELCMLAALGIPDRHVAFPKLDPQTKLQPLDSIAVRVLEAFGFQPEFVDEEERARREVETLARVGRWPILLTQLDTSGEKPYEEFVGEGETEVDVGLRAIAALPHRPTLARGSGLFEHLATLVNAPDETIGKADIVAAIKQVMANFNHVDTGRDLDQRL